MADGYIPLTFQSLQTPDGLNELNRMLMSLYENVAGDGNSVRILNGYGSPEGVVVASVGSLYQRIDGSTDTAVYKKESGSGATGWSAVSSTALINLDGGNPDSVYGGLDNIDAGAI